MSKPVTIIGVGAEGAGGLSETTRQRIRQADQLWGSERLLADWADLPSKKHIYSGQTQKLAAHLRQRRQEQVVILASGDPLFFGLAAALRRFFAPEELEVIPHVSALQLAFARVGVPWHDAALTSLHGRSAGEIITWARRSAKVGILTDRQNTPAVIADTLLAAGLPDCRAVVCENLGMPDERCTDTKLSQLSEKSFSPLNVVLLLQGDDWQPEALFSPRADDDYCHQRGLITKSDVRTLSIARLRLAETSIVWDIGAGSGAVAIEAAQIAWCGRVFAVEKDPQNFSCIEQNIERWGAFNVMPVLGCAPQTLAGLPRPAAVFIGGTGGRMEKILRALSRLVSPGCRLVINLATLENLDTARRILKELRWQPRLTQVNFSYGKNLANLTRLEPENPVFILDCTIPAGDQQ